MANAASPLYSLADLSQLDIDLHIPEAESIHLEVGAPVELELLDGTRFEASVIRRAPVVDVLTGTVKFVARALTFPAAPSLAPSAGRGCSSPNARPRTPCQPPRSSITRASRTPT